MAEVRASLYSDNSGLTVSSFGANLEQPVAEHVTATLRGVADHVVVDRTVVEVPPAITGNQATGHPEHLEADIVTSASSVVSGGAGSDKWRREIAPGVRWEGLSEDGPSSVGVVLRLSDEPDYTSTLLLARAETTFFENNTTVSVFAGYGWDSVEPFEAPPGQTADWPATHRRLLGGGALSQALSPALLVSFGGTATSQRGALSNPYRRATVRTSLFPEALPDARDRFTGFVAASYHVGWSTALHARVGAYADSWSVYALIPEAVVAKEVGERWLVELGYRYYRQSSASFYRPVYSAVEDILAGDLRLGRIHEHAASADVEWLILGHRDGFGALRADARVELSRLRYEQVPSDAVFAQIVQLGLAGSY